MQAFGSIILLVIAALFPIVNPIGSAPVFLGLTESVSAQERNTLALQIAINSFLLLLGSLLIGSYVLQFFGISLPVVRVGGGFLLIVLGWRLLNADPDPDHAAAKHAASSDVFYPLTLPLTVGPGCMAIAIALGTQSPHDGGVAGLIWYESAVIAGLFLIALSVYVSYRFAGRIVSFLGHGGVNVIVRLMAFILLCIGIQIMWNGWNGLTHPH